MAADSNIEGKSLLSDFSNGLVQFAETDSRCIGAKSVIDSNGTNSTFYARFFEVPTPAWYPDSFLRSIKRNNYMNMVNCASFEGKSGNGVNDGQSLDFYREDSSNVLTGLVTKAAKSVLSTAANQIVSITNKVDSLISGFNSIMDSFSGAKDKNLLKAIKENASNPFLSSQPYVNVYGIHLTESMRDVIISFQTLFGDVAADFGKAMWGELKSKLTTKDGENATSTISNFFKSMSEKTKNMLSTFLLEQQGYSGDLSSMIMKIVNDDSARMHSFAEVMLNATISGTYTMKCKLPLLGNDAPIMASCGADCFSNFVTDAGALKDGKGIIDGIHQTTGLNAIWSSPLDWKPDSFTRFTPLRCSFNIFNDTLEHTLLNLFFIWSFGATTKAVTDTFFIRPPYLYNVEIPGGFRYRYCTCKFEVTPQGKMRKLSSKGDDAIMTNLFKNIFSYEVNKNALDYVPDFYRVSVTFTSVLPDLWNYMDTYLHNSDLNKVRLGSHIATKLGTMMQSYNNNN